MPKRKVGRPKKRPAKRGRRRGLAKRRMEGDGILSGIDDWLKRTKIISSVGGYVLPTVGGIAGAAGGATLGTAEFPVVGTVSGAVVGEVVGQAAGTAVNERIKSYGYGQSGGAVYSQGKVPIHRPLVGAGRSIRPIGGRMKGGSSVYNNVVSRGAMIKF
jgi:hypothetical protein